MINLITLISYPIEQLIGDSIHLYYSIFSSLNYLTCIALVYCSNLVDSGASLINIESGIIIITLSVITVSLTIYSFIHFSGQNLGKKIFTTIVGGGSLGSIYSGGSQAFKDYQEYKKKLNSDNNSNNNPNPSSNPNPNPSSNPNPNPSSNSNPNPNNSSGSSGK